MINEDVKEILIRELREEISSLKAELSKIREIGENKEKVKTIETKLTGL
mgnify:CR=1 FL=1